MSERFTKKKLEAVRTRWAYEDGANLKAVIPADLLLGLKWTGDNGEKYTSVCHYHKETGKREARLILSNYVGTSIGAMHYYGRIEVSKPSGQIEGENGWHGGYMGKKAPELYSLHINVTRRISKVEKDMADEVIGKIGDRTYRFNREKDVLPEALKLFKKKFGPGWVLLDQYEGDVICET